MATQKNIVWRPNPGVQELFMNCRIPEILLSGNRGWGKSELVIMKFLKYVGTRKKPKYGKYWHGTILRVEREPLKELIRKSFDLIPLIFPTAKAMMGTGNEKWVFEDGEELYFRFGKDYRDYQNKFHGSQIPYIAFDELTAWADPEFYLSVRSCNRINDRKYQSVPKFVISTTNPYGVGHSWVKQRFVDPDPTGGRVIIETDYDHNNDPIEIKRVRLNGTILENTPFLENNPTYFAELKREKNKAKRLAWVYGIWDIQAGGYFEEYWDARFNVVEPFEIPKTWKIRRAYDHGKSKPFACIWTAESDGTPYFADNREFRTVKGDKFIIYELYGQKKDANPNVGLNWPLERVSQKILEIDKKIKKRFGIEVLPGAADSQINTADDVLSIRDKMLSYGLRWHDSVNKERKNGWLLMGDMMYNARNPMREKPALFIWSNCEHWLRTVPGLIQDEVDMDDIDSSQEDHLGDATRYELNTKIYGYSSGLRID